MTDKSTLEDIMLDLETAVERGSLGDWFGPELLLKYPLLMKELEGAHNDLRPSYHKLFELTVSKQKDAIRLTKLMDIIVEAMALCAFNMGYAAAQEDKNE